MPDRNPPATADQLGVIVHGVSPLIWRRLLVPGGASIAGLHAIVQAAFGWSGEHLHYFTVHGARYGICFDGGPVFRDDAHRVRLASLGAARERAVHLHLQLLRRLAAGPARGTDHRRPRCTGGRRAGPPEDWAGPWDYLQRTQPYLVDEAIVRAADILGQLLTSTDPDEVVEAGDWREEMTGLLPLLALERFDRRALNRALATTERKPAA